MLILQASAGCYTHLDGPHGRVPVGAFKIGRIARDQQPLLTNDVLHDPNIGDPAWARRENMVAFAGYPLLIDGRTVGVLAVFWRQAVSATLLEELAPIAQSIAQFIERKTTEAALAETAEQRRLALDSAQLGWWRFDLANNNIYWDERFKAIFGVKDEELAYERVISLLHPDDREKVDAAVKAAIRPDDPVPYSIEYRVVQDDGSLHWVQARGKAHFVGEGDSPPGRQPRGHGDGHQRGESRAGGPAGERGKISFALRVHRYGFLRHRNASGTTGATRPITGSWR